MGSADLDRSERVERKPEIKREPPTAPSRPDDSSRGYQSSRPDDSSRGYQPPGRGGWAGRGGRPDPYGRDRQDYERPLDRRAIEEGRRKREEERARGVVYTDSGECESEEE